MDDPGATIAGLCERILGHMTPHSDDDRAEVGAFLEHARDCAPDAPLEVILELLYTFLRSKRPASRGTRRGFQRLLVAVQFATGHGARVVPRYQHPYHRVTLETRRYKPTGPRESPHHARVVAAAIPDHPELQPFVRRMLRWRTTSTILVREVRSLALAARDHGITDVAALRALDGPAIADLRDTMARRYGWHRSTGARFVARMTRICRHPEVDVDGSFRRWAYAVDRATVRRLPAYVQRFDAAFLRMLAREDDGPSRDRLAAMALTVAMRNRCHTACHRLEERVFRSTGNMFCRTVAKLREIRGGRTLLELMPATAAQAVDLLARMIGHRNRFGTCRCIVEESAVAPLDDRGSEPFVRWTIACLRAGCFPGIDADAPLPRRMVWARLQELELEDPATYRTAPPAVRVVPKLPLNDEAIARFLSVCVNHEERVYVHLSSYSGLRAEAVDNLTVDALWDAATGAARTTVHVLEKNSTRRTIVFRDANAICRSYAASLAAYLREEHPGPPYRYLFFRPGEPALARRGVAQTFLARFCQRLGVPRAAYHHHQFRANVVARHMTTPGAQIETVSKFLGHRSSHVTFNKYWRVNVDLSADNQGHATVDGLQAEIRRKNEQILYLQERLLRAQRGIPTEEEEEDDDDHGDDEDDDECPSNGTDTVGTNASDTPPRHSASGNTSVPEDLLDL